MNNSASDLAFRAVRSDRVTQRHAHGGKINFCAFRFSNYFFVSVLELFDRALQVVHIVSGCAFCFGSLHKTQQLATQLSVLSTDQVEEDPAKLTLDLYEATVPQHPSS